jgi:hypothetical protein
MHFYSGPPMHLLSGVDTTPICDIEAGFASFEDQLRGR